MFLIPMVKAKDEHTMHFDVITDKKGNRESN